MYQSVQRYGQFEAGSAPPLDAGFHRGLSTTRQSTSTGADGWPVSTIHFARWVFLNRKKRLRFASNYDGSLESYMDDFINKVGSGLNVVFGNGIAYPRTRWMVLDEQDQKDQVRFAQARVTDRGLVQRDIPD